MEATDTSSQGNFWVGLLVIVVVVAVIVFWVRRSNKKTRNESWTGKVTDKKHSTSSDEDGETTDYYKLVVAVDGVAKPKKVSVNGAFFSSVEVGDKIEKKLGELHPNKVE